MMRCLALVLALAVTGGLARAEILPPPRIELYTMGPGDELFSAFGHAAICVFDAGDGDGRCYNYGTADFTTPVPLTWAFIRGRALFWVSVTDVHNMLRYYMDVGRAVYRQELPLGPDDARRAAALLAASAEEQAKFYRYHHFDDNCTTRIRDVLDKATGGALHLHAEDRGISFRQYARQGFAGNWPLLVATDLLLGRKADRHATSWTAMFLPSELRTVTATRLDAPPQLLLAGKWRPAPGAAWLGTLAFAVAGAILAIAIVVATRLGRRARRLALGLTAFVLGLIALILDLLALLSTFPELRHNELLLAFWPSDLLLPFLNQRLKTYLTVRLVVLALLTLLHAGLLVQPLGPLVLLALPLVAARLTERPSPPA
jgi:hypothetical protein